MTGRVKLQTGLIDNLTPPGDRAPPKIIMKKKFWILEFIKKCCFLTWKTQIGGRFAGAPCDQNLFFLLSTDSINSKLGWKSSFDKIWQQGVIWGQIFDFALKINSRWLIWAWVMKTWGIMIFDIKITFVVSNFISGQSGSNGVIFTKIDYFSFFLTSSSRFDQFSWIIAQNDQ